MKLKLKPAVGKLVEKLVTLAVPKTRNEDGPEHKRTG